MLGLQWTFLAPGIFLASAILVQAHERQFRKAEAFWSWLIPNEGSIRSSKPQIVGLPSSILFMRPLIFGVMETLGLNLLWVLPSSADSQPRTTPSQQGMCSLHYHAHPGPHFPLSLCPLSAGSWTGVVL